MKEMDELAAVMKRLRAPDGCPWDREQTHESLKSCMLGEVAEFLDAVDEKNDAEMREELGDILMEVVLNATIAEERGAFTLADATRDITEKMIRRHPHVFSTEKVQNSAEVVQLWDKIKKGEKGAERPSILDGVPCSVALQSAEKIQKKVAKVGFDWSSEKDVFAKVQEECSELGTALAQGDDAAIDEEAGDLLFAVVNLIRFRKRHPEEILAATNRKFIRRFKYVESHLAAQEKTPAEATLDEMENLWQEAKHGEPGDCPGKVAEN